LPLYNIFWKGSRYVYPTGDADLDLKLLVKEIAVLEEDLPNLEQLVYQVLSPFNPVPLRLCLE